MPKKDSCIPCIISTFFAVAAILFLGMVLAPLLNSLNFKETNCYVDYIQIPNTLPNVNNSENWVPCNCGRNCIFETACAKIYVTVDSTSTSVLLLPSTVSWYNNGSTCTFKNNRCENNINYMIESMKIAADNIEPYEYYKNMSHPITCYSNGYSEFAYLNNELLLRDYLAYSIIFGLSILCCCGLFCHGKES